MHINQIDLKLKISVENGALCSSAFFSLLKKFISKLEWLCTQSGVCHIANIELGDTVEEERPLKTACFDVVMENGHTIHVGTTARTLDDAVSNAFDSCAIQILSLRENRA